MNPILNINWTQLYDNTIKSKDMNMLRKYKPSLEDVNLYHVLASMANIPLVRNKNNKISVFDTLTNMPDPIETPNGPITKNTMSNIIKFLYEIPRGNILNKSQNKEPTLASLTPLPMYAFKLYNNVAYSEWDKSDKAMKFFLGKDLEFLLTDFTEVSLNRENVLANREKALTFMTGSKAGTQSSLTSYKCNITKLRVPGDGVEYAYDYITDIPKRAIIMLLQIWLANVEIRDTNAMILNPYTWDDIPKAFDVKLSKEAKLEVHSEWT